VLFLAVVLCGSLRQARADYLFTPFFGGAFAGRTAFLNLQQGAGATQLIFGGSAAWLSSGFLGFEGDFSYAPRFFERDNISESVNIDGVIGESSALTLTGNVIVAVPSRVSGYSLRPYLVGGAGLMRSSIPFELLPSVNDNSLGFDVGGGAMGFITPRTGIRFELRHFRTFGRQPNEANGEVSARLSFWRASVGVVIRR
jgi:hypothetical protein